MTRRRGRRHAARRQPVASAGAAGLPLADSETLLASKRYPIQHADQTFKDLRVMLIALAVLAIAFAGFSVATRQGSAVQLAGLKLPVYGAYLLLAAAELGLLAVLYEAKRRTYCVLTADALLLRYPLFRLPIPMESIKRVRVQPLRQAFLAPERRRYLNRPTKRLLDTPALYLRLDPRDAVYAEAARRLRGRIVYKDDLVFPIADAEELAAQLRARSGAGPPARGRGGG